MQRVRIGLMGLAVVFLLVLLAAAFFGLTSGGDVVRPGEGANGMTANAAAPVDPKEPMAELGVAPGGATAVENLAAPASGPVTIAAPPAPVLPSPQRR
jgi:hypothetical protein